MPEFTKGGRGKTAPYLTTHCRIPLPLKPIIDEMVARYKASLDDPDSLQGQAVIDDLATYLATDKVTVKPVNTLCDDSNLLGHLKDLLGIWQGKSKGKDNQPRWSNLIKFLKELEELIG